MSRDFAKARQTPGAGTPQHLPAATSRAARWPTGTGRTTPGNRTPSASTSWACRWEDAHRDRAPRS